MTEPPNTDTPSEGSPKSKVVGPNRIRGLAFLKKAYYFVSKWIIIPVVSAILGMAVVTRVTSIWSGPAAYKIYYVGPLHADPNPLQELQAAFDQVPDKALGGVPIRFQTEDDQGESSSADTIAARLAS